MEKMKICLVLAGNEEGGLEKHFADLCSHLAQRHEVLAIAHPMYKSWLPESVQFEAVDLSRSRRNPIALWQVLRVIRRWKPDLIHAHANKAAAMVGTLRPFFSAQCVATVHNLKKNVRMYDNFDRVIAVSRSVAEQLGNCKTAVIHNGIAPSVLPENTRREDLCREFGLAAERPVLISVGRLVPAKGFDILLPAMEGIDANLLVVGDGPERATLEDLASRLGLSEKVFFAGHRKDVPRLLASADMAVIASRNEGFPYVLVEALHVRQMILSTVVPGAVDVLPREMLVPIENISALREGILRALANMAEMRSLFEPVWTMAEVDLTVNGMVAKIEALYREVLDHG
jgi:glycosyltransferase involved in cell wall biosynthesis